MLQKKYSTTDLAPVKSEKEKPLKKKSKLTPLDEIQTNLSSYFAALRDPRVSRTKKHLLKDILVIAILAVIAGAEGWKDIENYGLSKQQWLEEFLELPNGIPSDDTFRRVFERIDPEALEQSLTKWVQQLIRSLKQQIIPIDGKCLRLEKGHHRTEKRLESPQVNLIERCGM